ncbi:hypothetical protein D3C76_1766250 [compost metagenome]
MPFLAERRIGQLHSITRYRPPVAGRPVPHSPAIAPGGAMLRDAPAGHNAATASVYPLHLQRYRVNSR